MQTLTSSPLWRDPGKEQHQGTQRSPIGAAPQPPPLAPSAPASRAAFFFFSVFFSDATGGLQEILRNCNLHLRKEVGGEKGLNARQGRGLLRLHGTGETPELALSTAKPRSFSVTSSWRFSSAQRT